MQCSDLSSTISGILVLQYGLEMRNITSLGVDGKIDSETAYSSFSLSPTPVNNSGVKPSIQKYSSAGQWRSNLLVLNSIQRLQPASIINLGLHIREYGVPCSCLTTHDEISRSLAASPAVQRGADLTMGRFAEPRQSRDLYQNSSHCPSLLFIFFHHGRIEI